MGRTGIDLNEMRCTQLSLHLASGVLRPGLKGSIASLACARHILQTSALLALLVRQEKGNAPFGWVSLCAPKGAPLEHQSQITHSSGSFTVWQMASISEPLMLQAAPNACGFGASSLVKLSSSSDKRVSPWPPQPSKTLLAPCLPPVRLACVAVLLDLRDHWAAHGQFPAQHLWLTQRLLLHGAFLLGTRVPRAFLCCYRIRLLGSSVVGRLPLLSLRPPLPQLCAPTRRRSASPDAHRAW